MVCTCLVKGRQTSYIHTPVFQRGGIWYDTWILAWVTHRVYPVYLCFSPVNRLTAGAFPLRHDSPPEGCGGGYQVLCPGWSGRPHWSNTQGPCYRFCVADLSSCLLSCPGSSAGRPLCLDYGVLWVPVPPRAALLLGVYTAVLSPFKRLAHNNDAIATFSCGKLLWDAIWQNGLTSVQVIGKHMNYEQ